MTRYVVSVEQVSPGWVNHFCPEDAPDIVQDLSDSLGSLLLDYPDVDRLEVTVEVQP